LLSIVITVGNAVVIFALIQFLNRHEMWYSSPKLRDLLSVWGGLAVLLSFATAITGLAKDRTKRYGVLALCLSLFSITFYAQ
jgi:hypothetical protein